MSNIAIFKIGEMPQYLKSVNTPDYSSDPDAIVNPDLAAVDGVKLKYWKRAGNTIVEMSQAEKDVISVAELAQRKLSANTFSANLDDIFTALVKVINQRLPAGQKITKAELITAVKKEIV